eukprot:CAMPEP_0197909222 /NCGR_PEP_ID=MMETSP1439-20131203/68456_1 /TAXON_ID=66791 /ORGANISM="Gonyaulax spinifera, Strain CCMP409" /LENGTH=329 /DNA_ID=CAMNT_0043530781 /DNA_START=81 /DNA_END=1070 /DNA_ORIENTATION=+
MKAWTILIVPVVASLGGLTPLDEDSLIQRDSRLHVTEVAAQAGADDNQGALQLPHALGQVPGMESMLGNMSMPDMMAMATKVLGTLRNETFVNALNQTLRDVLKAIRHVSEEASFRVSGLQAAGTNLTSEEDAYHLLKDYFKKDQEAILELANLVEMELTNLMKVMPSVSLGIPGVEQYMDPAKLKELLKEQLSGFYNGVLTCTNSTLCDELQPAVQNMTIAYTALGEQALPMISQAEGMIPSMGPMIGMIAPDVVDTVVSLANSTIGLVTPALTALKNSLHSEVKEVTKIAKTHAYCAIGAMGSGSARSGPGLFLFAAALSVWMSLRA